MVFTVESMHLVVFTCGIYQDDNGRATGRHIEIYNNNNLLASVAIALNYLLYSGLLCITLISCLLLMLVCVYFCLFCLSVFTFFLFQYVTNHPLKANSAFHPSGVGE